MSPGANKKRSDSGGGGSPRSGKGFAGRGSGKVFVHCGRGADALALSLTNKVASIVPVAGISQGVLPLSSARKL